MRRRSYGNSVSARNRQRILLQAYRTKVRIMRTILTYSVGRELGLRAYGQGGIESFHRETAMRRFLRTIFATLLQAIQLTHMYRSWKFAGVCNLSRNTVNALLLCDFEHCLYHLRFNNLVFFFSYSAFTRYNQTFKFAFDV